MTKKYAFHRQIVLLVCLVPSVAIWSQSSPKSDAQISVSQATIMAGDTLTVTLTLKAPFPCSPLVYIEFRNLQENSGAFTIGVSNPGNDTTLKLVGQIPKDITSGEYVSINGSANPCPGYQRSKSFTVSRLSVVVKSLPDATEPQNSAEITLSLTQKQFFDTKAAQLDSLTSQLNSRLEHDSADLPRLRGFLIETVSRAEDALSETENQYRPKIEASKGNLPAFFDDFRAQYQVLLVELKAPIPGLASSAEQEPVFSRVAFQKNSPGIQLYRTWPPAALAVWNLIKDNRLAYEYIRDSGRIDFPAQLSSTPTGARIQYRKYVDKDYVDYSSPTDIASASFELATWYFKFHLEGCNDEILRIDPYEDKKPVKISVTFTHCKGKR